MTDWINVNDQLPVSKDTFVICIVFVHRPRSDNFFDFGEDEFVSTAYFNTEQKVWEIGESGSGTSVNALIPIDEARGYYITHWMYLPEPPEEVET